MSIITIEPGPVVNVNVTPAPVAVVVTPPAPVNVALAATALAVTVTPPALVDVTVNPAGVAGPVGPTGPADAFYYEHVQALASAGWSIAHNLGKRPNVSVVIADEVVGVPVIHVDVNSAYVSFANPQTGRAICT